MKRIIIAGAVILSSLFSFQAMAQPSDEDAATAVANRQAVFKLLAFSNGPLGGMARGQMEFNAEAAVRAAERVAMLAPMIPELVLAVDTRSNSGFTTRAADTIWDNQEDFAGLAQELADAANAAIEILNDQGADGVRSAVQQIGPKCGACHDRFRLDP